MNFRDFFHMVKNRLIFSLAKALTIFGPFLALPLYTTNEPHPTPRPLSIFLRHTMFNVDGFPHLFFDYHRSKLVPQNERK